jgi:hypothetical protein
MHIHNKQMKKIGLLLLAALFSATGYAQTTNYKTVMVETNGVLYKPTNFFTTNLVVTVNSNGTTANPTNFWTANSNSIASVIPIVSEYAGIDWQKTISRSKFVTSFANVSTLLTNINPNLGESGWFTMFKDTGNTNLTASGQARLMRDVWASPTGAGLPFGQRNVQLTVDTSFGGGNAPTNIGRVVLGSGLGEYAAVPNSAAIGYEIRQATNAQNEIRLIAHNNTNLTTSGWVNVGGPDRWIISILGKTNGTVELYVGGQANITSGNLPTLRTNISGGPIVNSGGGEANLSCGIFVNSNTVSGEAIVFWSAVVSIED